MPENSPKPPRLASSILRILTRNEKLSLITGDLEEIYTDIYARKGRAGAAFWYWSQLFITLPPLFFRSIYWSYIMFGNYLKVALRNIKKSKSFTFINICGLVLGITSFLLIMLYVQYELSYDSFYEKSENVYRVALERTYPDRTHFWGWTPPILAVSLEKDYPEVLYGTRILTDVGETLVTYKDKGIIENRILYVDHNYFNVFLRPIIKGDPNTALRDPKTVVLTESTAIKYFGSEDPMGKTIQIRNNESEGESHTITGIVEDIPLNSHFHYDFLVSFSSTDLFEWTNWFNGWMVFSYIRLQDSFNAKEFEAKFPELIRAHFAPEIEEESGMTFSEYESKGNYYKFFTQPLEDIHLTSNLDNEIEQNGNTVYIYLFSFLALFIILIACINFMNLSTARSAGRAREVGIRKTFGSHRKQLIFQFMVESILLSLISFIIAVCLLEMLLPAFNEFSGKYLDIPYFSSVFIIPGLVFFMIVIGILSGSYPAFFLSSFHPVSVLKGKLQTGLKGKTARSVLVIFQFAASIALITGTLVIKEQTDFMINKDLGFDKEHVVVLHNARGLSDKIDSFKNELKKNPSVTSASFSGQYPASASHRAVYSLASEPSATGVSMFNTGADYDFIETMGMEIIKGRNYSREFASDTAGTIINESACRALGLTDPVGEEIEIAGFRKFTILGVIKDFHFRSLHNDIAPYRLGLNIRNDRFIGRFISVRIRNENIQGTLADIEKVWYRFSEGVPFNYSFLDKNLERLYRSEKKTGQITAIFSAIAVIIGCLGLFGLAAYTAEQRTKEIGIRKVLGATEINVMSLLVKEFIRLVLISIIFAVPVSYFVMNNWLRNFAYHWQIGPGVFLFSGCIALLVAVITVGYQAVKTARSNPVDSLKYE